jgi:hypothetical protein
VPNPTSDLRKIKLQRNNAVIIWRRWSRNSTAVRSRDRERFPARRRIGIGPKTRRANGLADLSR